MRLNAFRRRCRLFLILSFLLWAAPAAAVEIAITLDDHPMPDGCIFSIHERTACFCKILEKHQCKAAFFCIGSQCLKAPDPSCLIRINDAGHFLGNHSLHHRHLSSTSLDEFQNEVKMTEAILQPYSQFRKWFRYPYLDYGHHAHLGGSKEKFFSAIRILKENGYQEGFVTINTFDWLINARLQEALRNNKKVDYSRLKEAYLYLLNDWCCHYISAYQELPLKRMTHTILLHANDLNALFLNDILEMVKDNGWEIVSPEKAFTDSSWREIFLKHPQLMPGKPPSLNEEFIDQTLKSYSVFS